MATYTKTVDPNGGADYASIALWEAGEQTLYTSGDIAIADCKRTGSLKDTTAVVVSGWTIGVIPKIIVNAAHRHEGKFVDRRADNNFIYIIQVMQAAVINISTPATVVDGLYISGGDNGSARAILNGANNTVVQNCIMTLTEWVSSAGYAVYYAQIKANTNNVFRNNVVKGGCTYLIFSYDQLLAENNTLIRTGGVASGLFYSSSGLVTAKNNVVMGAQAGFLCFTGTFHADSNNNVSSDASAPGTNKAINKTDYAAYFVDHTTGDFHLKDTSFNLWGISGTDLSGTFTTDIDGQTRTGAWDIGADQYVAAGGTTYTETLITTITSLAAAADLQTYLEAANTLITSGASAESVQEMIEAVLSTATASGGVVDLAARVDACLTTVQSSASVTDAIAAVEDLLSIIQSSSSADNLLQAVESVQTAIFSVATVAEVAQLVEDLQTTIASSSAVTDTLQSGQLFSEVLLSTATSAAEASAAQSFVEAVSVLSQGTGSAAGLQGYLERLTTTGQAIASAADRQLYYDNLAIVALSTASVAAIGAYIEQVQTAAAGLGSVADVLRGAFVGQYIFVDLARARLFHDLAQRRSFTDYARPRRTLQ